MTARIAVVASSRTTAPLRLSGIRRRPSRSLLSCRADTTPAGSGIAFCQFTPGRSGAPPFREGSSPGTSCARRRAGRGRGTPRRSRRRSRRQAKDEEAACDQDQQQPEPAGFLDIRGFRPSSGTPGSAAGGGCAALMCPSRSGHGAYMCDYEKDPEQDAQCNAKTMKKTVVRHHPTLIIRSNARHGGLPDEGWPTAGALGGNPVRRLSACALSA